MKFSLLKPYTLACKNRFLQECRKSILNRDLVAGLVTLLLIGSIYHGTYSLLYEMRQQQSFTPEIGINLIHICLLGFFLLLIFSSCIAALNYFFSSKDIPLLLTAPLRREDFYSSRLLLIAANAGWMFLLFGIPSLVGYAHALDLSPLFYIVGLFSLIPFIFIPVLLSSICVIILISVVPAHRLRDVLILMAFAAIAAILYFAPTERAHLSTEETHVEDMLSYLNESVPPDPSWTPTSLTKELLFHAMQDQTAEVVLYAGILSAITIALYFLGFQVFSVFFLQGWSATIQGGPAMRVYDSRLRARFAPLFFGWNPQLRAIASKEWRLFIRDTTQSLQLLLLLTLTFVYLFNFRALREGSQFSEETFALWHVVLSLANISFGTCVVSAIVTRFVYPSISLEGQAYSLLRNSPMSLEQLLAYKYRIWFIPICFLCVLLLVSGAWAIQIPVAAVLATGILAVSLSVSIVGLGVGIGAVYAKFDWETPAQVTASFGSLVFMLLALGTILVTSIPALFIFALTCVPGFRAELSREHYLFVLGLSYFLVFAVNWVVANRALSAGAQRLRDLEV